MELDGDTKHVQVIELAVAAVDHEKAHELEIAEGGKATRRKEIIDSELEGDKLYPQELMSSSPLQPEKTKQTEKVASSPISETTTSSSPPTQNEENKIYQETVSSATITSPLSTHLTPEADAEMRLLQQEEQRILARKKEILKQAGG